MAVRDSIVDLFVRGFFRAATLLALGSSIGLSTGVAAERYTLTVPDDPTLTSSAVWDGRTLSITDPQGQTFVYIADRRLDSPDGSYLGFYSAQAQQAIRWPAKDAGSMFIGDLNGNWRMSLMKIVRERPAPGVPQPGPAPIRPQPGLQLPRGEVVRGQNPQRIDARTATPVSSRHLGLARMGNEQMMLARIDDGGRLQLYEGYRNRWQPRRHEFAQQLVPGAPLQVIGAAQPAAVPSVYTVSPAGQLIEIVDAQRVRTIGQNLRFAPGSQFRILDSGNGLLGYGVDARGQLVQFDGTTGQVLPIDADAGRYAPGTPISLMEGRPSELYLIDRRGALVGYELTGGRWAGPNVVTGGFVPGSQVAAFPVTLGNGTSFVSLAGVDERGRIRVLRNASGKWNQSFITNGQLGPGAPLALTSYGGNMLVSAVGPDGVWREWTSNDLTAWQQSQIGTGYAGGAPVWFDGFSQSGFAIDRLGRPVISSWGEGGWDSVFCSQQFDWSPRLVRRHLVANRPIDPVNVIFENRHHEDLIVQIIDEGVPRPPVELRIPAGGAVPQDLRRDAGAVLQETYAIPTPTGWVEEVETYELPPQGLQEVVVYVDRVTYSYIDRRKNKPAGALEDFDLKSLVSLGVFPLPPGEFLRNGERINVYAAAARSGNPGAAAWFPAP